MQKHNSVVVGNMPELPYAMEEALNRLRINISFLGSNIRKIMVISTMPNEGKSFVAMQLWRQMAEAGTPSILLDADLRKSVMSEKYEIAREDGKKFKGTSHFLAEDYPVEEAILHTNIEQGDILPNVDNVINPSMLLESEKFEQMLDYMAEHYRYVFLDSPPLNIVSDGERIGNLCDGAVLVARGGVTSKGMVKNSIRQLERAGCPLLGIVLNRVEGATGGYYSKRYGGKYYYGRKGKYYGSKYGYGYSDSDAYYYKK
jgi:capsular exopolysaccharide synthesis family protein